MREVERRMGRTFRRTKMNEKAKQLLDATLGEQSELWHNEVKI